MQGLHARMEDQGKHEQTGDKRESPYPTPLRQKGGDSPSRRTLIRREKVCFYPALAPQLVDGNILYRLAKRAGQISR